MERNAKAVILYDGFCHLCSGSARFIIKRDPHCYFRFIPLQSEAGKRHMESAGLSTDNLDTLILIEEGKAYIKSTAVFKIAARLNGAWSLTKTFLWIPSVIRDWLYDWIAGNRIQWFGRSDVCWIPSAKKRI